MIQAFYHHAALVLGEGNVGTRGNPEGRSLRGGGYSFE
jgi:hypothetical protein